MQGLQNAATILTQKKGTQQTRNTPIMIPTVMAALWSETWYALEFWALSLAAICKITVWTFQETKV